jgi:magnesium chelatase family protein
VRSNFQQYSQANINSFPDFSEVKGQNFAKRALMITAAGRHNIMMVGPPGSGKSMLAQRLPGIMPALEFEEALELTKLYSVAGRLAERGGIVTQRPFRAPHHSASLPGLVGGGSCPRPGEISLSHLGILFLDEFTEFPKATLDSLRQPLETGTVTISRAHHTFTYPASFLLVGACNPCPCGYRGDRVKFCVCTHGQAERYWARLSGPILDRIDLHVQVDRLTEVELSQDSSGTSTENMRLRVLRAVEMQKERSETNPFTFNGQLNQKQIRKFCQIDSASKKIMAQAVHQLGLSARAYDRIIRISRTIADLNASDQISSEHICEALRYRQLRAS